MPGEISKGFDLSHSIPEPLPSRFSMDSETKIQLHEEIKADPYFLHRRFKEELIELTEKFDDLDHDLSLGSDLQDYCYEARQLATSIKTADTGNSNIADPTIYLPNQEGTEIDRIPDEKLYHAMHRLMIEDEDGTARTFETGLLGASPMEYAEIFPDGTTNLYAATNGLEADSRSGARNGLRLVGVMRRAKIMRKFIECEPEDVKLRDKLVLDYPKFGVRVGTHTITGKVHWHKGWKR